MSNRIPDTGIPFSMSAWGMIPPQLRRQIVKDYKLNEPDEKEERMAKLMMALKDPRIKPYFDESLMKTKEILENPHEYNAKLLKESRKYKRPVSLLATFSDNEKMPLMADDSDDEEPSESNFSKPVEEIDNVPQIQVKSLERPIIFYLVLPDDKFVRLQVPTIDVSRSKTKVMVAFAESVSLQLPEGIEVGIHFNGDEKAPGFSGVFEYVDTFNYQGKTLMAFRMIQNQRDVMDISDAANNNLYEESVETMGESRETGDDLQVDNSN